MALVWLVKCTKDLMCITSILHHPHRCFGIARSHLIVVVWNSSQNIVIRSLSFECDGDVAILIETDRIETRAFVFVVCDSFDSC
ncbi:hypothetical protein C441_16434 [Haloferax sulfurifontis ATCC BAA-897]|uniref:Uncharacterized protein n=1 Tax=Haloferax sulfurifontis ATCC BAA-897 TaxID=662480 RepID=M0HWX8_9EURY|nr:hypothetical protein C441_16434 [Haloferax sulfurifontis ATCC BAA-897]